VAYSEASRELFASDEAFEAEQETEVYAKQVLAEVEKLGIKGKMCKGDVYFLTTALIDKPDVIINMIDTVHGKDKLSMTVPAFLGYANLEYTGCGITGMVIGNKRHLFKQLFEVNKIPTPPYKYIKDLRSNTP